MRVVYELINAPRMIYLKVSLPRNDSKQDREQGKEIAKDMKEKIGRMSQVFHNMHKLGQLSTRDSIMSGVFYKPKVTMIYHYEAGMLSFIVGIYPEYQKIIEGSISAQYSDCSIELVEAPQMFSKKYRDIMPLESKKDGVYNIKLFKQQPDDPVNNLIDAIGKISQYDTASIIMPIKPIGNRFNKKAQKWAEGLYRNDKEYLDDKPLILRLLNSINPIKIIKFLISGPQQANQKEEQFKD